MERAGRLGPSVRLWLPAVFRFRRVLKYGDRRSAHSRSSTSGEFRQAVFVAKPFGLLDPLAHVPFILDSRLRLFTSCDNSTGIVVAVFRAVYIHGRFWILARCEDHIHHLGALSWRVACRS